jgi:hypothetical protein
VVGTTVDTATKQWEDAERPWHAFATDMRSSAKRREYIEATGWSAAQALPELAGLMRTWLVEPVDRAKD